MFWVKIKTGKYKDYLGIVHEVGDINCCIAENTVITVQVEAPQDGFPYKEYKTKQVERIKNPNK